MTDRPTRLHGARARLQTWRDRLHRAGGQPLRALLAWPGLAPGLRRWLVETSRPAQDLLAGRLCESGLFDPQAYREANPDAGDDPLRHYLETGLHEGRALLTPARAAARLADVLASPEHAQIMDAMLRDPGAPAPGQRVRVYVNSFSNFFIREIGDLLVLAVRLAGGDAELHDERSPPVRGPHHRLFVAPHEFFALGRGGKWDSARYLSGAAVFSTEQIQSPWFGVSLPYLMRAGLVLDLSPQTAALLRGSGLAAHCIQPGHAAEFAPFGPVPDMSDSLALAAFGPQVRVFDTAASPWAARPFDMVFLGQHTPRRERFFVTHAAALAGLETFVYCAKDPAPLVAGRNPMADPRVTSGLLQRTKIVLNLHRDDTGFFEWMRFLQAVWQGAVMLTEPCLPHPLFQPDRHFLTEEPARIPDRLRWLTRSPEGQEAAGRMIREAQAAMRGAWSLAATGRRLIALLQDMQP